VRTIYGDKKNDINILYGPVLFACAIYLNSEKEKREKYIDLFRTASSGLDKLRETYTGNDIVYNIEQIKNIIDTFIANTDIELTTLVSNYNSPNYKLKTEIYKHINMIWTDERLLIIFNLYNEIKASNEASRSELIKSLDQFIDFIDIKVASIINDI
jgi:hypothetical protein